MLSFLSILKESLLSMKSMGLMLLVFAFAIGFATFIENDYGTDSAKALVYNAKWFELLLFLLALNLAGNIFRYKLYKKEKFPIFLFHLSFLVILLGAAVTRFFSYEGIMHIREGESTNKMLSESAYVSMKVADKHSHYNFESKVLFSAVGENSFDSNINVGNKEIDVRLLRFIPNAQKKGVPKDGGVGVITLIVASSSQNPTRVVMQEGDSAEPLGLKIAFNNDDLSEIKIELKDQKPYIDGAAQIAVFDMRSNSQEIFDPHTPIPLEEKKLYMSGNKQFVLQEFIPSGVVKYVPTFAPPQSQIDDLLIFEVESGKEKKTLYLFGKKGKEAKYEKTNINGMEIALGYGSKIIALPFFVKLNEFILTRYPGSMSPSSYRSEVEVIDGNRHFPYSIYMNNVLDYRGYRFYQASYDIDEQGTILSVNHDRIGTIITYIGYTMLGIGMFFSLFLHNGRVMRLASKIASLKSVAASIALLTLFVLPVNSIAGSIKDEVIKKVNAISLTHARKFGRLLVQDGGGRIKPVETMAFELLNKIYGKDSFSGLHPSQVLLGMIVNPDAWEKIKLIKVSDPKLREKLGLVDGEKYAAFIDFFSKENDPPYKLSYDIESAMQKKPAEQDRYDKDVIKVDERLNISYMIYTGSILNIFPMPNDKNRKWYNPIDAIKSFPKSESDNIKQMVYGYFDAVEKAMDSGDWQEADKFLAEIKRYQDFYGAAIIPEPTKIDAEIFYYNYNIFKMLMPIYGVIGVILLLTSLASILQPSIKTGYILKGAQILFSMAFLLHTFALALRWYISGHAPWSDGYESMIYISWATILAGLLLVRNNLLPLSAAAVLTSIILFVAHLSWVDPQITNLVPVLNSYWLTIHVSVITASYGFFGLSAILGVLSLLLMIIQNRGNFKRIKNSIAELTYINEITVLIGLTLLTIGNFLGGVWANESWGRYWGWDPKETWALVTIILYTFVAHIRFIKPIYSTFSFNALTVVMFYSVLMTYFGVNFYLSGLHSYAKGDPIPIPTFVYIMVGLTILLLVFAYRKRGIGDGINL